MLKITLTGAFLLGMAGVAFADPQVGNRCDGDQHCQMQVPPGQPAGPLPTLRCNLTTHMCEPLPPPGPGPGPQPGPVSGPAPTSGPGPIPGPGPQPGPGPVPH
jgi:hypothetical protein